MLVGYMRVSKADGSQTTALQRDALLAAGVDPDHLYDDHASGRRDDRPGLAACLKALRAGDTLVVWKLDRLGRNLHHLVNTVHDLTARGVGLKVLTGQGAAIDTTTPAGKLVFAIFAALAEFERDAARGISLVIPRGRLCRVDHDWRTVSLLMRGGGLGVVGIITGSPGRPAGCPGLDSGRRAYSAA